MSPWAAALVVFVIGSIPALRLPFGEHFSVFCFVSYMCFYFIPVFLPVFTHTTLSSPGLILRLVVFQATFYSLQPLLATASGGTRVLSPW